MIRLAPGQQASFGMSPPQKTFKVWAAAARDAISISPMPPLRPSRYQWSLVLRGCEGRHFRLRDEAVILGRQPGPCPARQVLDGRKGAPAGSLALQYIEEFLVIARIDEGIARTRND